MKKYRAVTFVLCLLLFLSIAVSCTPAEDEKPFVSGLGTTINAYQEYGGWIYYIDYANTANLYKIKSNGEKKTLIIDEPVHSFVIYENKIFYTNWEFYVYTSNLDGSNDKKLYSLNEDLLADGTIRAQKMQITDDWIYILIDLRFYKIKTDGTEKTKINIISKDFHVTGDNIYYLKEINVGKYGFQLWQMKIDGTLDQQLMQELSYAIDYDEDWIYYISPDDKFIYKVSFDGKEKHKFVECEARYIKAFGDWIYYEHTGENKGLYKIKKDGSENTYIRENGDWEIEDNGNTYIVNNRVSYYGMFDQYLLCYWDEISAIELGESMTEELTHDIISGWPDTTIYD